MKYASWLKRWLNYYVKPTVKIQTYEKYNRVSEKYIITALGGSETDELTSEVLQDFIINLTENGLSPNTVNGIITIVKSSLRFAVKLCISQKDNSDTIVRPKMREKHMQCFTVDEQRKIERWIFIKDKPNLFGIVLCLYTGLRIGELLALEWEDVNFTNNTIYVSRSCRDSWTNGKYVKLFDTPKTESSERIIPIPRQLVPKLKALKRERDSEFVVGGKSDCGAQIRSYQRTFENILVKLKLPHRGFHSLRHTFATRALECGMDIKTLSEILGHRNPTVTLKIYAHSLTEHKADMMNRVGKLLKL